MGSGVFRAVEGRHWRGLDGLETAPPGDSGGNGGIHERPGETGRVVTQPDGDNGVNGRENGEIALCSLSPAVSKFS